MKILIWIARALMLSILAIGSIGYFILFLPFVMALVITTWQASGIRRIMGGGGILVILVFPIYIFMSSFIHYGSIHIYDQPDIATLIAFIACIAGCCGAILNIVIGYWQLKNKPLVT